MFWFLVPGFWLLFLAASFAIAPYPVATFDEVRASWKSADAWLLDRHGEPLSKIRVDRQRRRGEWVALADVSRPMVEAAIAAEDRRFEAHGGVDWMAMLGAARQSSVGDRRGGSTLTMQLAAELEPRLGEAGRRGALDKWRQMRQALAIERSWSKAQVLEAWLNLTPFRGEIEGIDAAARVIAGKPAAGLDRAEGAVLAALVRAPNAAPERVAQRVCQAAPGDEALCNAARAMAAFGFRAVRAAGAGGEAPHAARRLLSKAGERRVSSLDARVQRVARESLKRHLRELEGRNVEDGAVVVLDNATGEVLAYVGSSGELSRAGEVDGAAAPRQAGSTLKPFLYALAIEERRLTAASILDDSPLAVTTEAGLYVPQNYDRSFRGPVTLRHALAGSLNVPAVRTLALVGPPALHSRLRRLGMETLDRDAAHYGYGLALGGAEVSALQLANAYRTLANRGRAAPVTFSVGGQGTGARGQEAVIDERAAFIVADILADPGARAITFGFAGPLATPYRASVKTGTSKDMHDNWAAGFTARHTVVVWVGNFSGEPMHDVSGVSGAAPVWRDVMDFLAAGEAQATRPAPEGVVHQAVRFTDALEPDRDEWFIAGTEIRTVTAVAAPAGRARLASPANGAIYALDPDMPGDHQRVPLRASGAEPGTRFAFADGRVLDATHPVLWTPSRGRHRVALLAPDGSELDHATFEVR